MKLQRLFLKITRYWFGHKSTVPQSWTKINLYCFMDLRLCGKPFLIRLKYL